MSATLDGQVIASLEDYRIVRDLVFDLISDAVDTTVPRTMRETVAAVGAEVEIEPETSYSKVARRLNLDKSAGKRRVDAAIAKGYVRNNETGRGKPARLVLGDPLPSDVIVLPTVEAVVARLQDCSGGDNGELEDTPW